MCSMSTAMTATAAAATPMHTALRAQFHEKKIKFLATKNKSIYEPVLLSKLKPFFPFQFQRKNL